MNDQQYLAADAIYTIGQARDRVSSGQGTEEDFDLLCEIAEFMVVWLGDHYSISEEKMLAHEVDDFVEHIVAGGNNEEVSDDS